jgi:hypothetical protein
VITGFKDVESYLQVCSAEDGAKLWRLLNARTEVATLVMRQVRAEIVRDAWDCVYCHADVGEPCTVPSTGEPLERLHAARWERGDEL